MRNYKKESEWQRNKYTYFGTYLEKQLGIALKEKLKNENKTITWWVRENAIKYLER